MKNIGIITTNKVLAQSLAAAIKSRAGLALEPFLLLDARQAALDAEVLGIDIAVVDVLDRTSAQAQAILPLCNQLRKARPDLRLLLLVSQDDAAGRETALSAMKGRIADDFVFYDTSLAYLFAKLAAF